MATEPVRFEVLSPRGALPGGESYQASAGLASLKGKKIGILNNTKSGGDLLLPYVLEALKGRVGEIEFQEWRVPFMLDPAEKEPRLVEIAAQTDGVIALTGD
jgi:hypothetical protein